MRRLAGLEQEYAVRYSPAAGEGLPSNRLVFVALLSSIDRLQPGIVPADQLLELERAVVPGAGTFLLNGGRLYYEAISKAPDAGLIELATPECRGPGQLLTYERAQDELLRRALPGARERLREHGFEGELDLIKNCRDAFGHVYGAQENYRVVIARGPWLWAWRLSAGALLIVPALVTLVCWILAAALSTLALALAAVLLGLALIATLALSALSILEARVDRGWSVLDRAFDALDRAFSVRLRPRGERPRGPGALALRAFDVGLSFALSLPHTWLARALLFREHRRELAGFFASRVVLSGAGAFDPERGSSLSEKARAVGELQRWSLSDRRAMFDPVEVYRSAQGLLVGQLRQCAGLLAREQRLQIGCSDANLCEVAGYLKLGTTLLVLDLLEAGALDGLPRPMDPVRALHALDADPTLRAKVPMSDGVERTAVEIQRLYLERARRHHRASKVADVEAANVLGLWEETLDALERDPRSLFGRLDWVTKQVLLERCVEPGAPEAGDVRTKLALRYAELDTGYHRQIDTEGLAAHLLRAEDVERAITEAPSGTRAFERARLIRELAREGGPRDIGWDRVRVGPWWRAKVIRLDAARGRRDRKP